MGLKPSEKSFTTPFSLVFPVLFLKYYRNKVHNLFFQAFFAWNRYIFVALTNKKLLVPS